MDKGIQIFRLSGGLGNQFFSFAAGYQCCKERGEKLALDVSTQEAAWFFRNFDLSNYAIEYDKKISYRLGDKWYDHLFLNHLFRRLAIGFFTPTLSERMVNDAGCGVVSLSYVRSGEFDRELTPTDIDAKEILIMGRKEKE